MNDSEAVIAKIKFVVGQVLAKITSIPSPLIKQYAIDVFNLN